MIWQLLKVAWGAAGLVLLNPAGKIKAGYQPPKDSSAAPQRALLPRFVVEVHRFLCLFC